MPLILFRTRLKLINLIQMPIQMRFFFYNSKNDIWFGQNGFVWHFRQRKNSFEIIKLKQAAKVTDIEAVGKDHLIFTTNSSGFYVYSLKNKSLINFDKSEYGIYKNK